MPELAHIDYNEAKYRASDYVVYANLTSSHVISGDRKYFEFCYCSDLYVENATISSIFKNCDLSRSTFYCCYITKEAFFGGCNFTGVTFTRCYFETEEMYVFMQMVSKVKECKVGTRKDAVVLYERQL